MPLSIFYIGLVPFVPSENGTLTILGVFSRKTNDSAAERLWLPRTI